MFRKGVVMGSRRRHASSDSVATGGRNTTVLVPPHDLSVFRFTIESEDYVLLTFDLPDKDVRPPNLDRLTQAERAILRLVLHGYSNSGIAQVRGKSASTIANQLYAIYRKLGVKSRRELMAIKAPSLMARM